ncbi:MAG TPA: clostripain-related cysteine peptidase [Fimbriimonadaceae bacterium]|nr:clostripain-related cysteine peptidase [Fimbriimonadaceae bacterium]
MKKRRLSDVVGKNGWATLLFAAAVIVVGCGGGGGGRGGTTGGGCADTTQPGALVYGTVWGADATSGSQFISIVDGSGRPLASKVLNKADGSQTTLSGFRSGDYEIVAELYTQPDAQGAKLGEIRTAMSICGTTSMSTEVGGQPASVKVYPATASMTVQDSRKFYATLQTANDRSIFVQPGSFSWQAVGNVASVDPSGLVVATAVGAGNIRATHSPSGLIGGANVTVTPFNTTRTKWTVLVYLNAANDLFAFSDLNVNQMEKVADNPQVRFVVQWKQYRQRWPNSSFDGTRRYLVKPDSSASIKSQIVQTLPNGTDMGRAQTLREFVDWGRTFYPADRYCLVIWNHGNGWRRSPDEEKTRAVSYDDETGNAIQIWELNQALGDNRFDIVAWDASLMQMFEVAYEIQDHTDYVVGSEESPPGEGYPYDAVFGRFRDNPNETTRNLTKAFVDGMINDPRYTSKKITQSSLDTSKFGALATALDEYAGALIANKAAVTSQVQNARTNAQSFSPTFGRFYRDMIDVTRVMDRVGGLPPAVSQAAANLRTAAQQAVVWEAHNANSPNSAGIAFDFSPGDRFSEFANDYSLMRISQATRWNEWLAQAP